MNPPSTIYFPVAVTSSVNETSITFLTEYPSDWSCSPNPPNNLHPLWSPERRPFANITSQSQNIPNYHFHLGILYSDDPPDHHYENPPQVFQSSQQTFTIEGHQPSHYLFYQILPRRLWQDLNKEVLLRNLPHILSQSFCLFSPLIMREHYQSLTNPPQLLFGETLTARETKDRTFSPDPDNIGVVILVLSSVALI